ncbi:adenylate/guanylate cyclase domain-containing protein [Breoghania sp. L-A4]|uniref:adenylate/guanylate cyclase domain-containing protein n=1 Tax=Breoghania sp. L-A4 TaxID=2304600 RepID=UPI000E35AF24|nr:adenylate/guanylate cyclase domain-containing protein [Breoghania sp. L-A4]AXS42035.1 adenylate/guanylate cyclase domain-containing protein [Breoghania sp. L-A4]
MSHAAMITSVEDWLTDQALGSPSIATMYREVCVRLSVIGIPIARSMITWPILHPLIKIETALWRRDQNVVLEQYPHREKESEEWQRSPLKHLLDAGQVLMRRRLSGPEALIDFPLLADLAEQGYTDYLAMVTEFTVPRMGKDQHETGILISWASDRPSGFSDEDIIALRRIQRGFAVACRTVIQARIANNITETYLGRHAAEQVLAGNIRRGDGITTKAVILYSDLRDSTKLAETLDHDDYLALLNDYYECSASAAIDAGGEVLAFIGDAVLSVFALSETMVYEDAIRAASLSVQDAIARGDAVNRTRRETGLAPFRFGVSASVGEVMLGNIGVPTRLTFSVIGPAVNAAARIEKLTKTVGAQALATAAIAAVFPDCWQSIGPHRLDGMATPVELYRLREDMSYQAAVA